MFATCDKCARSSPGNKILTFSTLGKTTVKFLGEIGLVLLFVSLENGPGYFTHNEVYR